jgi:hypothetical protein
MTEELEAEATQESGLTQNVIDILSGLEAEDKLTAEAVVDLARDPDHPLHDRIFRETDDEAAYQRRLDLARGVIRRWKIYVTGGGVISYPMRAVLHVPSEDRYKRTERAFLENTAEVEAMLRRELESIQRKYGMLTRFGKIVQETLLNG